MRKTTKILSFLLTLLILIPATGINFNTHICGKTEDVSKSIIIPGIKSAKECDKCHEVIVVKFCCSNKNKEQAKKLPIKTKKKGCCKDILEFNSFDYLAINNYVLNPNEVVVDFLAVPSFELSNIELKQDKRLYINIRLRPFVDDIIALKCSYLI